MTYINLLWVYSNFKKQKVMGIIDCLITKKNKPSFEKSQNRYTFFFQDLSKGLKNSQFS